MRQNKTFAIRNAADYLGKLRWDFQQLKQIPMHESAFFSYQAINCAITAWQMGDWVFGDLSDQRKLQLLGKHFTIRKFREYLQTESVALALCREIADAGKHQTIRFNPNPDISTEALRFVGEESQTEGVLWYIDNGQRIMDLRALFDEAIFFWLQFLNDENMLIRSANLPQ